MIVETILEVKCFLDRRKRTKSGGNITHLPLFKELKRKPQKMREETGCPLKINVVTHFQRNPRSEHTNSTIKKREEK